MTRFIHDQFAKDYLEELLSCLGEVQTARTVRGEVREIDVWFFPRSPSEKNRENLGLLGKLASKSCLSKKSGLKPRLLRRKVFGADGCGLGGSPHEQPVQEAGHKSLLQKHPPASCLLPPAFVNRAFS
jgi:hypothetical protein